MMTCLVLASDAGLSVPIQTLFEPCDGCALESRLDELDQGYRECHVRLARINSTAAEAADWLAAKLDVLKTRPRAASRIGTAPSSTPWRRISNQWRRRVP